MHIFSPFNTAHVHVYNSIQAQILIVYSYIQDIVWQLTKSINSAINSTKKWPRDAYLCIDSYLQWSLNDTLCYIDHQIDLFTMNMSKTIVRRFIYLFYIRLPLILFYYMNLYFPILFINILWSYILSTTALLCRRSIHMRKVVVASKTLVTAVRHSIKKVTHMKISQIILLAWKCSIDVSYNTSVLCMTMSI